MLRSRTLVAANVVMLLFSTVGFGMPFILTLYAQQVLGYSAVEFGLDLDRVPGRRHGRRDRGPGAWSAGSASARRRGGPGADRRGCLYLTQVSPGGSYFGDIFLGLLICGPGVGLTFVTCSIAALAGVAEREAGLASGMNNTMFQIGAALGTAIVSTVVFSRGRGGGVVAALTDGLQAGFAACIVLAAVGLVLCSGSARDRGGPLEPVPQPAAH